MRTPATTRRVVRMTIDLLGSSCFMMVATALLARVDGCPATPQRWVRRVRDQQPFIVVSMVHFFGDMRGLRGLNIVLLGRL